MLTFATILDNPGEQPHATRYRDPNHLHALGYSDLIVYETSGLSGLLGPDTLDTVELRSWVAHQYEKVQHTAQTAKQAGMGVWLTYDGLSLARELVGSAMTCVNKQPPMICPASDELLEMTGQCLDALLHRIDGVDGIVLRLGDSDAAKVPYLHGNDVYAPHCARCSPLGRADRLVRLINYFYRLIVQRLGRRLIVRAWNIKPGGMHDSPELCQRVIERLPEDDRLILSFKFTETDFWRYQRWNPSSLACEGRPIVYELQCQREFEGKGAVPNFQPPLWRDGMPEHDEAIGLAEAAKQVNLVGLWAWVRGGGWRGPYVNADGETWIDANVYAVPKLAQNPAADVDALAHAWATERLHCDDASAVETIVRVLRDSTRTVLESFYIGPYARRRGDAWYPSANVLQDDQVDAEAAWSIVQQLSNDDLDAMINEKAAAAQRLVDDRDALVQLNSRLDRHHAQAMITSLDYAHTLVQTLRHLLEGMAAYRRHRRRSDPAHAQAALRSMRACQRFWIEHTQRVARHGAASAFSSDNLWDFTQQIIDTMHDGAEARR